MKQIIYIILTIGLVFQSCEQKDTPNEDTKLEQETEKKIHSIEVGDVEIITIDSCEYIVYKEKEGPNHAYGYMAHKGNCNNPIHCYNELENSAVSEDIN